MRYEKPPPTKWEFPSLNNLPGGDDLIAVGADLQLPTLLNAYRSGYFPMPIDRHRIGWFSPDPRAIIEADSLKISRSLRRSLRRYELRVNTAFVDVIAGCADPTRPLGWIDKQIRTSYTHLHRLGWCHSVEAWDSQGLAGGLYGVAIGGLFAGESMFHHRTDASKVALVCLMELLGDSSDILLDVQWNTPHLTSLGTTEVSRAEYLQRLARAIELPLPPAFEPMLG